MIVDAHAHIFVEIRTQPGSEPKSDLGYGEVMAGSRRVRVLPPLNECTTHTVEMLLAGMDWAGVDKAVLLQGPFYGECNDLVAKAVREHPGRLAGAAYFDPWSSDRREFERVFQPGLFKALKIEFTMGGLSGIHKGARIDSEGIAWLWRELERRQLVLTIDLGAPGEFCYQTAAVRGIAEAHPALKIVICHLALPRPENEADPELLRLWAEQIDLGRLHNVWFDCAALPYYLTEEGYPFPSAGRYLRRAVERIGARKIMWGTDIPALLTVATYPQLVSMARLHSEFLVAADQAKLLGENALDVYGL
jgi:predicted TIM-barrel fold metal-dependent hydrolase